MKVSTTCFLREMCQKSDTNNTSLLRCTFHARFPFSCCTECIIIQIRNLIVDYSVNNSQCKMNEAHNNTISRHSSSSSSSEWALHNRTTQEFKNNHSLLYRQPSFAVVITIADCRLPLPLPLLSTPGIHHSFPLVAV